MRNHSFLNKNLLMKPIEYLNSLIIKCKTSIVKEIKEPSKISIAIFSFLSGFLIDTLSEGPQEYLRNSICNNFRKDIIINGRVREDAKNIELSDVEVNIESFVATAKTSIDTTDNLGRFSIKCTNQIPYEWLCGESDDSVRIHIYKIKPTIFIYESYIQIKNIIKGDSIFIQVPNKNLN